MTASKKSVRGPSAELMRERARGALLGLSVGDALGATHEGQMLAAPPFPQLLTGLQRDVVGHGPHHVLPGQVTDGTQQAVALATSLRTMKRYDTADALRRYQAWLPFATGADDQTRAALAAWTPAQGPFGGARNWWLHEAKRPAGSGSLARTAPIGVALCQDREARIRAALEDSLLTHPHPHCALSCALLDGAVASAIRTDGPVDPERLVSALLGEASMAAAALGRLVPDGVRDVQEAVAAVREDLALAQQPDPQLYGPWLHMHRQMDSSRVALRLSFWELFHAPSLEAALVDVVNRGGKSNANAAVTGALLGAVFGESRLPAAWRGAVLGANPRQPALRDTFHPRELLALAESAGAAAIRRDR